jgi:peptidoglycan/xylan/chitin deacetylase (PgdA/CDA1 family)
MPAALCRLQQCDTRCTAQSLVTVPALIIEATYMTIYSSDRLVVNFHGLGEPPAEIPIEERPYWCGRATFLGLLDHIPKVEEKSRTKIELTFDDGNMSDYTIATPALIERGLRAAFFVCAGRIGVSGYLDGSAMSQMLSAGMEIGSHGWSHTNWRLADDATLTHEIDDARERIATEIGRPVDSVGIPFGSYDRRVLARLRTWGTIYTSDGYRAAGHGRIVPRLSYVKDWDEGTLLHAASEPYNVARRMRLQISHLFKRLR